MSEGFIIPIVEYLRVAGEVDSIIEDMMFDVEHEAYMDFCEKCCLELDCEMWVWSGELCPGCDCDTIMEDYDVCDEEEYEEGEDWIEYLDTWE